MTVAKGIEQLPSGRFRLRIRLGGRPVSEVCDTLEDAIATRDAAKRLFVDEGMQAVHGSSLTQLTAPFFRSRADHRAAIKDRNVWDTHVLAAPFAARPVTTLTRPEILDWVQSLRRKTTAYPHGDRPVKDLSHQTRKHILNKLKAFFVWAIEREIATVNPTAGVKIARVDGDEDEGPQEGWYLDAGEQARLLAAADPQERWILAFAIGTGLRQGEQWCLHLADVHADDAAPHVIVRFGSWDHVKERFRGPKGKGGEKKTRRVPLFGLGLEAARQWLATLPAYAPKNPRGLMFPTPRGKLRGASKPPATWAATVERMGTIPRLGRAVWWHLLRHTCASSLVAGWWGKRWTLDEVRAVLGHTSVKITERYAHMAPAVIQDLATASDAAWRTSCHAVATRDKNMGVLAESAGRPGRRMKGGIVGELGMSVPRRGNGVAIAERLLLAIAEQDPHALQIAIDLADLVLTEAASLPHPRQAVRA